MSLNTVNVIVDCIVTAVMACMQDASAMYLEAVEAMEDEGQETMALDIFRQAIGELHLLSAMCSAALKGLEFRVSGYLLCAWA